MNGHDTFRQAVDRLSESTLAAAAAAGRPLDEIDLFAFHQANGRILTAVGERLGLTAPRVIDCIDRYGNTSAATIPLALADARAAGRLAPGADGAARRLRRRAHLGRDRDRVGRSDGRRSTDALTGCAIVTGSARGIGAATATALAADGLAGGRQLPLRRRERRGARRPDRATTAGARSRSAADVTDPEQIETLFERAEEELGPVLVLVNNAGMRADGLAPQLAAEQWRQRARDQPLGRLPHDPPGAAADAARALRPDRQRRLDRRPPRQRRASPTTRPRRRA